MNRNKKSAKQYHQSAIAALKQRVNEMKNSAYSGLYSEIAYIIGILVIMIEKFFPDKEVTDVNCMGKIMKMILIVLALGSMFYFAKKVKTMDEIKEEEKFWPNFFIQWSTSLGYMNMPVALLTILVSLDIGIKWTLCMIGLIVFLTGLTFIEALKKTSNIKKRK